MALLSCPGGWEKLPPLVVKACMEPMAKNKKRKAITDFDGCSILEMWLCLYQTRTCRPNESLPCALTAK
jgi:hypothetical protein